MCSHELILHLSILDKQDGRDIAYTELCRQVLVTIYIYLTYDDASIIFGCKLVNHRTHKLTRTTPSSPKIYDHRFTFGKKCLKVRISYLHCHSLNCYLVTNLFILQSYYKKVKCGKI